MSEQEQCDDDLDTIDGRFMDAVNEYASTCDYCGELTLHELFAFVDTATQLGACKACVHKHGLEATTQQPTDGMFCPTWEPTQPIEQRSRP